MKSTLRLASWPVLLARLPLLIVLAVTLAVTLQAPSAELWMLPLLGALWLAEKLRQQWEPMARMRDAQRRAQKLWRP